MEGARRVKYLWERKENGGDVSFKTSLARLRVKHVIIEITDEAAADVNTDQSRE